MSLLNTIVEEMTKGNFSFAILVVGFAQLVVMTISLIRQKGKRDGKEIKQR